MTHEAQHDLAQEHVLERQHSLGIILARQAFQRFKKIRVAGIGSGSEAAELRGRQADARSLVIFVFGVKDPGLLVELRLQHRRAVDGIGGRPRRRQRGLGSRSVGYSVSNSALEEVNLGQDHLVVQPFELAQQPCNESKGLLVGAGLKEQPSEANLQALPEEDAPLRPRPLDVFSCHRDLDFRRIGVRRERRLGEEVDEGPHELGSFCLGDGGHERSGRPDDRGERLRVLAVSVELSQLDERRLLFAERRVVPRACMRSLVSGPTSCEASGVDAPGCRSRMSLSMASAFVGSVAMSRFASSTDGADADGPAPLVAMLPLPIDTRSSWASSSSKPYRRVESSKSGWQC